MKSPEKKATPLDTSPANQAAELLDALRDNPAWDETRRADQLDRLVARFPRETLVRAILPRLGDLGGGDGEAILRILEAMGDPSILAALADALVAQSGLSPARTWDALGVLEGTGLIESRPELLDRRDDLEELLGDDQTLDELAAEIDGDPSSTWLALQGLCRIEPEIRAEIVSGLAEGEAGPGVVELLRLLAHAHDPSTRRAALEGLSGPIGDHPEGLMAWAALAADHPDPAVRKLAAATLGGEAGAMVASWKAEGSGRPRPTLRRSAVGGVDRSGRGLVLLLAEDRGEGVAAAFHCDVIEGIVDVVGESGGWPGAAGPFFDRIIDDPAREWVEDRHGLALGLLAGSGLLCGPETSPALAYWLERTAGPDFRPSPIPAASFGAERDATTSPERSERARAVLEAVPDWRDDSGLTYELADAIRLRDGDTPPDLARDPGAFRILFENRLGAKLEMYRRMLLWMAYLWQATGRSPLARAAESVAEELADPSRAVPGHPFLEALAVRSLAAAQDDLRRGLDPRTSRRGGAPS